MNSNNLYPVTFQYENLELKPVTDPTQFSEVVHGTYWDAWKIIQTEGLNRMKVISCDFYLTAIFAKTL